MNAWLPALASGVAVALVTRLLLPPRTRLAPRLIPYSLRGRTGLGHRLGTGTAAGLVSRTTLRRLLGPPVQSLGRLLDRVIEGDGEAAVLLRLRRADLLQDVPEADRVQEYRVRQLAATAGGTALGAVLGATVFGSAVAALGLSLTGFVAGATRWRGRMDRSIETRRERIRMELYTVNQLLAMRTRTGGGVVQAAQMVADRGDGIVANDLRDALRLHRGGLSVAEAFERLAEITPEPFAARTYRLLGGAEQRGTDLGRGLLALSEAVREARRDTMRRRATKRRAAMLLPIIGLMAPVMLLFVVAPVTQIVFGITR